MRLCQVIDVRITVISRGTICCASKLRYEMALLLALVLGDRLESSFRLALTTSGGSYATFLDTASIVVLGSALGLLLLVQGLA